MMNDEEWREYSVTETDAQAWKDLREGTGIALLTPYGIRLYKHADELVGA